MNSPLEQNEHVSLREHPHGPARFLTGLVAVGAIVLGTALLVLPIAVPVLGWSVLALVALVLLLLSLALFGAASLPRVPAGGIRIITMIGVVSALLAVALVVIAVAMRLFLPLPDRSVVVQFSNLAGRVQIEYCPDLPASFAGRIAGADLDKATTTVPVWVSSKTCGNPEFPDGVRLHLERASITIGDTE